MKTVEQSMRRGFDFTMNNEMQEMNNEMQEMINEMQEMTNEMQEMIKTKGTNERMGDEPQAQENESKLIQAHKALKMRDRDLTAAIRRCHIELAKKRKSLSEIEATKDAVEAAWNKFNHATASYCARAGENLSTYPHRCFGYFEEEGQPEEACQALYEWKVLTDMMEQVVDKAEEYLESATKDKQPEEACRALYEWKVLTDMMEQ